MDGSRWRRFSFRGTSQAARETTISGSTLDEETAAGHPAREIDLVPLAQAEAGVRSRFSSPAIAPAGPDGNNQREQSARAAESPPSLRLTESSPFPAGSSGRRLRSPPPPPPLFVPADRVRSVSLTPAERAYQRSVARARGRNSLSSGSQDAESAASEAHHDPAELSTMEILLKFDTSSNQAQEDDEQLRLRASAQAFQARRRQHREVLRQLRRRHLNYERPFWQTILSPLAPKWTKPSLPKLDRLAEIAEDFFPPPMKQKIFVCDFWPDRAERFETDMGHIEAAWKSKPEGVTVRWIHAPVGRGIVHGTIEDMFLHYSYKGRPFSQAGRAHFPYVGADRLHFQKRTEISDRRDAFRELSKIDALTQTLNRQIMDGDHNSSLERDLRWRADYVGLAPLRYWDVVNQDHATLFAEEFRMYSQNPTFEAEHKSILDAATLSRYPGFEQAQLVCASFDFYHRADGYLLTICGSQGIDYVGRNAPQQLNQPPEDIEGDADASIIGHVLDRFKNTGCSVWHRNNVEWLLVYLATEFAATPHTIRHGFGTKSLVNIYRNMVQNLKDKKYDRWVPNQSIDLMKAYLTCTDELASLRKIFQEKHALYTRLRADVARLEAQDQASGLPPSNPSGESALQRIDWALDAISHDLEAYKTLHGEIASATQTLFQLKNIEVSDRALTNDYYQRAIFVFTLFTIVFLPLSFFTSYYGMNLQGVVDTRRDEMYFWKVCGSITFVTVGIVAVYATRGSVRALLKGIKKLLGQGEEEDGKDEEVLQLKSEKRVPDGGLA